MKKSVMTKILVIGAACLVLGCGKKEEATQEPKEPETEITNIQLSITKRFIQSFNFYRFINTVYPSARE